MAITWPKSEHRYIDRPWRGPMGMYKSTDPEERLPKQSSEVHVDLLDLENPEDRVKYQEILSKESYGLAVRSESQYVREGGLKLMLVWQELFYCDPKHYEQLQGLEELSQVQIAAHVPDDSSSTEIIQPKVLADNIIYLDNKKEQSPTQEDIDERTRKNNDTPGNDAGYTSFQEG
jgi:hypothetical protein